MAAQGQNVKKWPIGKLKAHPRQQHIFGDLPEAELDALAEDIKLNGQRDPVEILPDGTLVSGHQRLLAAKKLKWTHIDVIVRSDLAQAGEAAVETHFINSNLLRRQLSPLGKARAIRRLLEIPKGRVNYLQRAELKEKLARRLDMTPRNVNRYLAVIEAPVPVQVAFDRGKLSLVIAGRVGSLSRPDQTAIAERITAGEPPSSVVGEYLSHSGSNTPSVNPSFTRMVRALQREMRILKGKVSQINLPRVQKNVATLRQAYGLLQEIIERNDLAEA